MRFSSLFLLALSACPGPADDTDPDTGVDTERDTQADTERDTEADTEIDTEADTEPDTEADTEPDTEADTEPDTEADTEPDTEAFAQCSGATLIQAPFTLAGDDFFSDYALAGDFGSGSGCDISNPPDLQPVALVEVDAVAGQTLRVRETSPMDSVVYVVDGCNAGDACLARNDDPDSLFEFDVQTTGRLVIALTSYFPADGPTPYAFDITLTDQEICGNGIDDDLDGAVDCNDASCDDVCGGTCDPMVVSLPFSSSVPSAGSNANTLRYFECTAGITSYPYDLVEVILAAGESVRVLSPDGVTGLVVDGCDVGGACGVEVDTAPYYSADGEVLLLAPGLTGEGAYTIERLPPEDCSNGIDDSGEGLIDCDDTVRCFDAPACTFECPSTVSLPFSASGTAWNVDHDDLLLFEEVGGCEGGQTNSGTTSGDLILPVDLSQGERIVISESGSLDSVVNVVRGTCNPSGLGNTCVASNDDANGEELVFEAPATDIYYIVVNAYWNDASPGAYDLTVRRLPPEDCATNDDVDEDELAGCDDPDCFSVGECTIQCDLPDFLPVNESGSNFSADFDDLYDFTETGGCEGGSGGGGADALYTVFPNPGDTIRVKESGSMDSIVNITAGDDACTPLRSDNECVYSIDDEANDGAVRLFEVTEDVAHHITVSSYFSDADDSYDIAIDVVPEFECGPELAYGVYNFAGPSWDDIWPDEVSRSDGRGCESTGSGGGEAMFRALLSSGDVIQIQDLTSDGGPDHVVNISTDPCGEIPTSGPICVYGSDDPFGVGLPEIYTYVVSTSGGPEWHTIQVGTFSSTSDDRAFDFSVSILEAE